MSNVSIHHWFYQHFVCRLLAASLSLLRTDTGKTCFYHHVNRVMQLFYGDSIDGIRVRLLPLYCLSVFLLVLCRSVVSMRSGPQFNSVVVVYC